MRVPLAHRHQRTAISDYSVGSGFGSLGGASSNASVPPPVPPNGVYVAVRAFHQPSKVPVPLPRDNRDSMVWVPALTGKTQVTGAEPKKVGAAPAPSECAASGS
jgi:hypothetical protein